MKKLAYGECFAFPLRNPGRVVSNWPKPIEDEAANSWVIDSDGTRNKLFLPSFGNPLESMPLSFYLNGFEAAKGLLTAEKLTPEDVALATELRAERKATFIELGERIAATYEIPKLHCPEDMRGKRENVKVALTYAEVGACIPDARIEYGIVTGHRRYYGWPAWIALTKKLGRKDIDLKIGADIKSFASDADRFNHVMLENEKSFDSGYNEEEKFFLMCGIASEDVSVGATHAARQVGMPDKSRQRAWNWAKVHAICPSVSIADRVVAPVVTDEAYSPDCRIPIGKLAGPDGGVLFNPAKGKRSDLVASILDEDQKTPATAEQVEAYLEAKLTAKQKRTQPMLTKAKLSELVTLASASKDKTASVHKVLDAVLKDKPKTIQNLLK